MGKTYNNDINDFEVSLAIEHLLVAPVGTSYPTGRVDVATPPTGFVHLGAVVEDSPQVSITRQKYQLSTGIPSILQYDVVQGLSGQFSMSFYSNANRVVRYALGGAAAFNTITTTTTVTTATSRTQITIGTSTGFSVGDVVVTGVTSASSLNFAENTAEISSISGNILYFKGEGLASPPVVSQVVGRCTQIDLAFGTTQIARYAIIGVADFVDGVQLQHHFPKVSPVGQFTESINPGQVGVVQATFDLFATSATSWGSDYILGKRVYVPRTL